jgi:hypothetical protein
MNIPRILPVSLYVCVTYLQTCQPGVKIFREISLQNQGDVHTCIKKDIDFPFFREIVKNAEIYKTKNQGDSHSPIKSRPGSP